jgi:hypothetical protein
MLNSLKDMAAKQVGKVLSSDATMKVLSSPQLQEALVKAVTLRAEAIDMVDKGVKGLAKSLELVTREDVAKLRRSIRDLEDQLADMQAKLAEVEAAPSEEADESSPAPKKKARGRKDG